MSDAQQWTPSAIAAVGYEIVLALVGLVLLWRTVIGPKARASARRLIANWNIPVVDFGFYLAFAILGAACLSSASALLTRHSGSDAALVVGAGGFHVGALCGIVLFWALYRRREFGDIFSTPSRGDLVSGLATFLIALPVLFAVSNLWEYALGLMGVPAEKQELVDLLEKSGSPMLRLGLMLEATLLVPLSEEMIFRAGLFRFARTRVPRWVAIIGTSLVFGALHVEWSNHMKGIASFLPLTALASIFCLAYERTGRIATTMVAHALFNLNTLILVFAGVGS